MSLYYVNCAFLQCQITRLPIEKETEKSYILKVNRACRRKVVDKNKVDLEYLQDGNGVFSDLRTAQEAMLNWVEHELNKVKVRKKALTTLRKDIEKINVYSYSP